jgi:hypothetical protein
MSRIAALRLRANVVRTPARPHVGTRGSLPGVRSLRFAALSCRKSRSDKRKPLPWVATACRSERMVTRGSTSHLLRSLRSGRGKATRSSAIPLCSPHGQPRIPRSSRRRFPEAPAQPRESPQPLRPKALLSAGIPAYPRSARKRHDRPVTPEVAGSSPVAPVSKSACKSAFTVACLDGATGFDYTPTTHEPGYSRCQPAIAGRGPS